MIASANGCLYSLKAALGNGLGSFMAISTPLTLLRTTFACPPHTSTSYGGIHIEGRVKLGGMTTHSCPNTTRIQRARLIHCLLCDRAHESGRNFACSMVGFSNLSSITTRSRACCGERLATRSLTGADDGCTTRIHVKAAGTHSE